MTVAWEGTGLFPGEGIVRSWIGRVVFGLGGFLVVAGLLGLVWAPGVVEKTPVDVMTITYLDGEAGKLDAATGELVRNPIYAISDTRTDSDVSTDDVVAWVSTSCVMIDRGGERACVDGHAGRQRIVGYARDGDTQMVNHRP